MHFKSLPSVLVSCLLIIAPGAFGADLKISPQTKVWKDKPKNPCVIHYNVPHVPNESQWLNTIVEKHFAAHLPADLKNEKDITCDKFGGVYILYDVHRNAKHLLSLNIYAHWSDKSDPNLREYHFPLTVHIGDQKAVELKDLFKENTTYVDKLNKILKEKSLPNWFGAKSAPEFKGIKQDQAFYLRPKKLVVVFSSGELIPNSKSHYEFHIPLEDLKEHLKDWVLN